MSSPLPVITYPPELPVSQRRDDIAAAIRDNQVVIVAGATGSGKTTQLPKICLELGREHIGHTQPRRIAARTIAERVAEELGGGELGGLVGYQVRFTDKVSSETRVKLMTDGILLNEIHFDRDLKRYDTIIIDEAHERSLTIDFLLGYLKRLLPRRPDLKLIITSATIDPESFSKHFDDAPIIEVSGRTYPVEIRYRPLVAEDQDDDADDESDSRTGDSGNAADDRDTLQGITDALDELAQEDPGDVLVFLSGENEIRDAQDAIEGKRYPGTEVLPLYGRLSAADQHRVFERRHTPGIRRRVVLATNVAETSLTVPGIKYVIDTGTARISRYSPRAKVQRLPIEAISQASASQRSGRAGRTSAGIAIRLYSEDDFGRRPEYTDPEILRTNLAAVILQMISLGFGDIESFPFLQPPDSRGVKDGLDLLRELRAVDKDGRITKSGRQLTRLPIDPRLGRMVLEAARQGVGREVIAIVSALSIQDPRERPLEKRAHADQLHARFADPTSDFLTLLNLWNHIEDQQEELSSSAFRRLCKAEFLNYLRIREWQDLYRQLSRAAKQVDVRVGQSRSDDGDAVHRALLAGLLSQIGLRDREKRDYLGSRNTRFVVFPGSVLAKKQPDAVMAAELVETSRLFARTVGRIDPAWVEPLAGDLLKRTYGEPHWEKKQGAVVAYERVTLFGVPIVQRRRVQYSRIDPEHSRELFIRHALVEGEWESQQAFDRANRKLRKELEQLEERTRRRDILLDDENVYEFYDARIPADVATTRDFEGWWRTTRREQPDLLTMRRSDLLDESAAEAAEDDVEYPTQWRSGDQRLAIQYRFEPGAQDDGVSVQVPLALLPRMREEGFDWQVRGLRKELVTALIKSLPKQIRKNVVPAADWAEKIVAELPDDAPTEPTESFRATLAKAIQRMTYVPVSESDFDLSRVPAHLLPTWAVVDERGRRVETGKDLSALQTKLKDRTQQSVASATAKGARRTGGAARVASAGAGRPLEQSGLTAWPDQDLPQTLDTQQAGGVIRAYPSLVEEGTGPKATVGVQLLATPSDRVVRMPAGVRRLVMHAVPSPVSYIQSHLTAQEKLALAASPYPSTAALFDDVLAAVVDAGIRRAHPDGLVFTKAEFEAVRDAVSGSVVDTMFTAVSEVAAVLAAQRSAERALKQANSMSLLAALSDMRQQMERLVFPGFVAVAGLDRLRRIRVYLQGIEARVQKLLQNPGRDATWMREVTVATDRYTDAGGAFPPAVGAHPELVHARWMLEEFRLSLFAQELGTAETVSLQRITKALTAAR
ncbi:ATP-dependent RNA helicase HrpA [Curtobacterium flaccumfaciens]|uniref:ATP-dependent RNA helicase HrpA n=1 Tax=Curtobacterium flaccumfaciens TaxID=2035 RepID=UPI001BDDF534|nr:ATP-dependent RNA helicase HrpA [Curtobacterium flaccumfaciens]MBT1607533.1 ATP-dependent RNA helicase HrpA [Curtobacterium flaccumfaciens pv. betae]MBT1657618.1 ATP-dependent RNA helicase HrpA [Curtobacterium flaccumfaciens pv. betae]MCS0471917.1 ATP-dependent RNA helicase HrpA [Curtobacterium flaccumfaciens pv. betae]MCS0474724.1 ATP-dependent RNA helicase HrpA [Curtobacterium flaccumfaciens pv. betae]MCS0478330.1 ATP-dependent RNA helicase HrpA [Curtobacterium flaccumfaciens pv. betae]